MWADWLSAQRLGPLAKLFFKFSVVDFVKFDWCEQTVCALCVDEEGAKQNVAYAGFAFVAIEVFGLNGDGHFRLDPLFVWYGSLSGHSFRTSTGLRIYLRTPMNGVWQPTEDVTFPCTL